MREAVLHVMILTNVKVVQRTVTISPIAETLKAVSIVNVVMDTMVMASHVSTLMSVDSHTPPPPQLTPHQMMLQNKRVMMG